MNLPKLPTFARRTPLLGFGCLVLLLLPHLSPLLYSTPLKNTLWSSGSSLVDDEVYWPIISTLSNSSALHPRGLFSPSMPLSIPTPSSGLAKLVLVYGDYVNEFSQEPTEVWEGLFNELGYTSTSCHIASLQVPSDTDLLVVLPSVGTHSPDLGVTNNQAQAIGNTGLPVLLIGYAHEVLDCLWDFDPVTDFIPCTERYLWPSDSSFQIFSAPYNIPFDNDRLDIYTDHVVYDAYRISRLPAYASVLGSNIGQTGAQLLWFYAYAENTQLYYWGLDQANHLNDDGSQLMENLLHWLLRSSLADRLGATLASWQLVIPEQGNYWAVQGAGGFGYPLEPSITLTYYVSDLVTTHTLSVNISAYGDWLLNASYNPTLGCFEDLSSPQLQDRCVTTGMSILSLAALNRLGDLETDVVGDYLASCQDPITGSFFEEVGASKTNLKATYFALSGLAVLGQLNKINASAATSYIASCQELEIASTEYGGFYSSPSGDIVCSLVSTHYALEALNILGTLSSIDQSALLLFLEACEDPSGSGIFDTKHTLDNDEWVLGTSCALRLLELLNALGSFNVTASRVFLLDNQFPNGGWGRGDLDHDFHNSPDETWYAVLGLTVTGGLDGVTVNLEHYLNDCYTGWGGATESYQFGDFLTGWNIISSLAEVGGLAAINQTAFSIYLDNCWLTALDSFGWHQKPDSVGTDTDVATSDRCVVESSTFGPLYHYAYSQLADLLNLEGYPWSTYSDQIRAEIIASQTFASEYYGMFGLHHLYVGHESDLTFRFDGTCWSLIAHQKLSGIPTELLNATAALDYLQNCLQDNGTHQYFHDSLRTLSLPVRWRKAGGHIADTWLGLQAYAYLDPTLNGLNASRLATYATSYLDNVTSLITAFYAVDILNLLAELGLKPGAPNLIDKDPIKTLLVDGSAYSGLVQEPTLEVGRWIPYTTDLAVKLANRLNLLPVLDENPALNMTVLSIPTGILWCGDTTTITVTVKETRWNILPDNLTFHASIFNTTFINFTGPDQLDYWNCSLIIPSTFSALGWQNLVLTASALGALPDQETLFQICEVWGNPSVETIYSPGLTVPRSIPLNISIMVLLAGGSEPEAAVTDANVTIINTNTSESFPLVHEGIGTYDSQVPTSALEANRYLLMLNVTAPFVTGYTRTDILCVEVYVTSLNYISVIPEEPIAVEPLDLMIRLQDENASNLAGYEVSFQITPPGAAQPTFEMNNITNATGVAKCQWIPDEVGQWTATYSFSAQYQYEASSNQCTVQVSRRPVSSTIEQLSPAEVYVGNQSQLQVTVTDAINGSVLSNHLVTFYEGETLLYTAFTDDNGQIIFSWLASEPLGDRYFHFGVSETILYAEWVSAPFVVQVRAVTSTIITTWTNSLFLGETFEVTISVIANGCSAPNGTASLYWDGVWQFDFQVNEGVGLAQFRIPYSYTPGNHLLVILFGHLDTPDLYDSSDAFVLVNLLPVYTPTLTLTVSPTEIYDSANTPTVSITIHLFLENGTLTQGLSANVTLILYATNGSTLLQIIYQTDDSGIANWNIPTPQPGVYRIEALFTGILGFAPATDIATLIIQPSLLLMGTAIPLAIISLALIVGGLLAGIYIFTRLQRHANQAVQLLLTKSHHRAILPVSPLNSLTNGRPVSSTQDGEVTNTSSSSAQEQTPTSPSNESGREEDAMGRGEQT